VRRKKILLTLVSVLLVLMPAPASGAGRVWHVVRPGDTMSSVARQYGLRTAELARWNQVLSPYRVYVDEVLRLNPPPFGRLPAWRTRAEYVTPESVGWNPVRRCPVAPSLLRRVWVSYLDFNGGYHDGALIVRRDIVTQTQNAFQTLYRMRFRIMAMAPMSVNMPGETDMSIVTGAYNCRPVAGTRTWSQHAYGYAIDVNPLQNPMFRGAYIDPSAGKFYHDRAQYKIGMMHSAGAVGAFTANGFYWGGGWMSLKDYMHFSPANR
jgi:LysM repeat protein